MTNNISSTRIFHISLLLTILALFLSLAAQKRHITNLFNTNNHAFVQKVAADADTNKDVGSPTRLQIPKLGIDAFVQNLGVTPTGTMETPSNSYDVGWFKLGPRPGQIGSAVIAGHYDGVTSPSGIFANLYLLKKGDMVYIIDTFGHTKTFVVRTSELFDEGYAENVFSPNDAAHLNLITCDGAWDEQNQRYTKRLVVFTDLTI